jgi:hypothetical protein
VRPRAKDLHGECGGKDESNGNEVFSSWLFPRDSESGADNRIRPLRRFSVNCFRAIDFSDITERTSKPLTTEPAWRWRVWTGGRPAVF